MRSPHVRGQLGSDTVDYWGPFVPLLAQGLGWRSPALGLQRWLRGGASTEHPVLAVVDRWWGSYIPSYLASATAGTVDAAVRSWFDSHVPKSASRPGGEPEPQEPDRRWQHLWSGGGDPMHLSYHLDLNERTDKFWVTRGPEAERRACFVAESYSGWYSQLGRSGPTRTSTGESWLVDVFVKPLGWLGTYRQSRDTGAWFSGRHRWHQMGW